MYAAEEALSMIGWRARSAQMYAQVVYDYARKAYRSDELDDAVYYMQKAKSSASNLMSAALLMQD